MTATAALCDPVVIARRAAFRVGRGHWRLLVGAAWQRAHRAAAEGKPSSLVFRAAVFGAIDGLRHDSAGWRPKSGFRGRLRAAYPCSDRLYAQFAREGESAGLEPTAPADGPADRGLALWCETAPLRDEVPPRDRLWLYLWAVEGLTHRAIAGLFTVSPSLVTMALIDARRAIAGRRAGAA